MGALTRIHAGFLGSAVSDRRAFSGWRGRKSFVVESKMIAMPHS
jgi:hypothetical protein